MKIQKFKKKTNLKRTYLLMFLVVLIPVVLNFYAPNLMGRGLKNSIITATMIIFGFWFFLSLFLERACSCDYNIPYEAIKKIYGLWVLNKKPRNKKIHNLRILIFAISIKSLSSIFTLGRFKRMSIVTPQGLNSISVKEFFNSPNTQYS